MNRKLFDTTLSLVVGLAIATVGFAADQAMTHRASPKTHAARQMQTASDYRQASAEHKQPVTLAIGGAEDSQSASLLTGTLKEQGLQATVRESKGQPYELTTTVPRTMDLSAASKAIMSAKTAQKSAIPPSFDFVLFAPLTKAKAKQAIDRLRSLKGVDTKNSHANVNKGELWVRINGSARVTPDDVYNAFHAAGIDAHFTRESSKSS
jgi:hypothetical protein